MAHRVLRAGQVAEVDVDLVDAAVFDQRRHLGHGGLELARVVAVLLEVHRQQHGVRRQRGRLHQAHAGVHAVVARRVGGGGGHAAAGVAGQGGIAARAVGQQHRLVAPPAADHHRLAEEVGVAQQLHRRIEGVHVEVGDPAAGGHGSARGLAGTVGAVGSD